MADAFKIAVIGDRITVNGFKALGLDTYPCGGADRAKSLIRRLAAENYAILYITEQLAAEIEADIARYKDSVTPAIILIPGSQGSLGIGQHALHEAVERAVGSDIL